MAPHLIHLLLKLPAPNPLTKADDALAQMDILGQQDTAKQNTTTVDANLLPDTTISLQSSTQQNLAIQQPLEPLPTPWPMMRNHLQGMLQPIPTFWHPPPPKPWWKW
jgi:hypothetical protein